MECVNCGKPVTEGHSKEVPLFGWRVCQQCERAGNSLAKELEEGIELTYSDGTKEIVKEEVWLMMNGYEARL